jgi:predicted kinase
LTEIAATHDCTAAEVALAWVLEVSPYVVAIPGARRPETARSCARAATLTLTGYERAKLSEAFGDVRPRRVTPSRDREDADVVVVMGIPGAGKSRVAQDYVARGYLRLNRDARGGSLRDLATELDSALASGGRKIVLDNTYLTRTSRSHVIETAQRHGIAARCICAGQSRRTAARGFWLVARSRRIASAGAARTGHPLTHVPDARGPRARTTHAA